MHLTLGECNVHELPEEESPEKFINSMKAVQKNLVEVGVKSKKMELEWQRDGKCPVNYPALVEDFTKNIFPTVEIKFMKMNGSFKVLPHYDYNDS